MKQVIKRVNKSYTVMVKYMTASAIILFCGISICKAQKNEKDLGDETIVIDKGYKPMLAEGEKISESPKNDTTLVQTPVMKYEVSNVQSETKYIINPVKPLRVRDEYIKELYRGFVKAGYGFPSLPYMEIAYNSLRSKDFDAGVHFRHLSSKGTIKEFGYPGFSNNTLNLQATKYLEHADLKVKLDYDRDLYHFYGYDAEEIFFEKKETRHIFNTLNTSLEYTGRTEDADDFQYKAKVAFYNSKNNLKVTENNFNVNAYLGKNIGKGNVDGIIDASINKIEQELQSQTNTLVSISPRYNISLYPWKLSAGININVLSEFDQTEVFVFPYARFNYQLIENKLSVLGEVGNALKQNNFLTLSRENPFIDNENIYHATHTLFTGTFGANAMLGKGVQFHASVKYDNNIGDVFFINKETVPVKFSTIYLNDQVVRIHGDISYDPAKKLFASVSIDNYNYTFDNDSLMPLYKPAVRAGVALGYNLRDKITVRTDLYINAKANYFDHELNDYAKLKSWVDVNLYAEYRYTKLLSFFVDINNVGFAKYQRYYNYPVFPFNAMAGFSYSF